MLAILTLNTALARVVARATETSTIETRSGLFNTLRTLKRHQSHSAALHDIGAVSRWRAVSLSIDDHSISHTEHSSAASYRSFTVSRHNNRRPELANLSQQGENALSCCRVEVSSWLIGEYQSRTVRNGARDRYPLHLTTRESAGHRALPVAHT